MQPLPWALSEPETRTIHIPHANVACSVCLRRLLSIVLASSRRRTRVCSNVLAALAACCSARGMAFAVVNRCGPLIF